MKILKRNFEHRNIIIFLIFSLIYLQAIYSLSSGISFFGIQSLSSFFKEHALILTVVAFAVYTVVKVKKHSDKVLLIALCLITGKNFILLSSSFNKLILALNFIYLIFAFYFFVMWEMEMAKASYNPLFSRFDLEKEKRFAIKGTIQGEELEPVTAYVTNIDEYSSFIYLPENQVKLEPVKSYILKTNFEGVEFEHPVRVVSAYDRGYGLVLVKTSKNCPDWSDLYKVCLERGLFV